MRWLCVVAVLFALLQSPVFAAGEPLSMREAAAQLEDMKWYTEDYPPYNFKKDGHLTGISVEILMAAFKKIGVGVERKDIRIAPWNRSYKFVQRKPGTALFSMTYTPERQEIMKFVGPAAPIQVAVIAPKVAKLKGLTRDKLGDLKIGVVRDDIGDQLLRKFAVSDEFIQRKNSLKQLIYLLKKGRVDAVAYAVGVFNFAVKIDGGHPGEYEPILPLKSGAMGFAFHNSTNPSVLAPLQQAIDELRAEGQIEKIISAFNK